MTDEEKLVELKELVDYCVVPMGVVRNLVLEEIHDLEKRIYIKNKMADLKEGGRGDKRRSD